MKECDRSQINQEFVGKLWSLTPEGIFSLQTLVYWVFDKESSSKKAFLIENQLFSTNYREKMFDLIRVGEWNFKDEVDTGIVIVREGGSLTHESWCKMDELRKQLHRKLGQEIV